MAGTTTFCQGPVLSGIGRVGSGEQPIRSGQASRGPREQHGSSYRGRGGMWWEGRGSRGRVLAAVGSRGCRLLAARARRAVAVAGGAATLLSLPMLLRQRGAPLWWLIRLLLGFVVRCKTKPVMTIAVLAALLVGTQGAAL